MKDLINTIREALKIEGFICTHGADAPAHITEALAALDQIEALAGQPVAWGMQHTDGAILDVISPEEHAREEGGYVVPLYRAAPVAQQPRQCGLCGSDEAFTGTCGGGKSNPRALCYETVAQQPQSDDYKGWYDEAMCASNEAGFVGASAADTIRELARELAALKQPQAEAVPSDVTDAMVVAGARALCNRFADTGGVSREDQWNIYAEDFKDDARAVLNAAIAQQKGASHE